MVVFRIVRFVFTLSVFAERTPLCGDSRLKLPNVKLGVRPAITLSLVFTTQEGVKGPLGAPPFSLEVVTVRVPHAEPANASDAASKRLHASFRIGWVDSFIAFCRVWFRNKVVFLEARTAADQITCSSLAQTPALHGSRLHLFDHLSLGSALWFMTQQSNRTLPRASIPKAGNCTITGIGDGNVRTLPRSFVQNLFLIFWCLSTPRA